MIKNVSVIMPTYNCESFISAAIKSILSQTFANFELIIIDDGSTDDTLNVVRQFEDKRIVYRKIEHSGISVALNFGLEISSFDWIARMDADDISHPDRLKKQVEILNHHEEYSVISSWYALFRSDKAMHLFKLPTTHDQILAGLNLHSVLCHAGSLYKKEVVFEIKGYRKRNFEDYDLWLRLKDNVKFYNIPEVLILVRNRTESLIKISRRFNEEILTMQRRYFKDKQGGSIDLKLEGWREWFYGNKNEARKLWYKFKRFILSDFRIILAILLSFLPNKYFQSIKSMNIKARLQYMFLLSRKDKKSLNNIIKNNS